MAAVDILVVTDRKGERGRQRRHAVEGVAAARVCAGHDRPGGAVGMDNQGVVDAIVGGATDGPDVGCAGCGHGDQPVGRRPRDLRAGGGREGRAVPVADQRLRGRGRDRRLDVWIAIRLPVVADSPDIGRRDGGHPEEDVVAVADVHRLVRIPCTRGDPLEGLRMLDERGVGVVADCPDVANVGGSARNGRHAPEVVVARSGVGCRHLRPGRAVPLHREGLVRSGIGLSVGADRPHIAGGDRRHAVVRDGVVGQTGVYLGHLVERRVAVGRDSWRYRRSC